MISWRYVAGRQVKHMMKEGTQHAICSAGRSEYSVFDWKDDEEGLDTKRECRNCTWISKGKAFNRV